MLPLLTVLVVVLAVFVIILWVKVARLEKNIWAIRCKIFPGAKDVWRGTGVAGNPPVSGPVPPAGNPYPPQAADTRQYAPPGQTLPPEPDGRQPVPNYPVQQVPPRERETTESWFGRNVLGIAASVLIFIGLVLLGTLVYKQFTEAMKIFVMYVLSAIITGLGILLTVKKHNTFTELLAGCGCGAFFISILLTHIYFGRINDIAAFSLLLVWMAAILYLSKRLTSTVLSVIAHIGMIISICLAFGMSLTDNKLLLLLVYQTAAIAVILLGNILCCKKTYPLGVFLSLFLTVIASVCMWARFTQNVYLPGMFPFASKLPLPVITSAFIAQFLCASFLSYLLAVYAGRIKNTSFAMAVHVANKALWLAALSMNIYHIVYRLAAGMHARTVWDMTASARLSAVFTAVIICLIILLLHAGLTLLMSLRLNFSSSLETCSVFILSAAASIYLMILWGYQLAAGVLFPRIPCLLAVALLLLLAKRISKNQAYTVGAFVIMAVDLLFMLVDGYRSLTHFGTIALAIGYLMLYLGVILSQWLLQDDAGRVKYSKPARLALLLTFELSLIPIFVMETYPYRATILLLLLTALNLLLYFYRYDRHAEKYSALRVVMQINVLTLLAVDAGFIAFAHKNIVETVLYLILAMLALGLSLIRIKEVFGSAENNAEGILIGVKLTILTLATVYGETRWFDQAYVFSLCCMIIALLTIALGFAGRVRSLRLYGLVMTLVCVLKLVTYDVTSLNTPLRIITFIGGGVICFIISAIYHYASKRIDSQNSTQRIDEE